MDDYNSHAHYEPFFFKALDPKRDVAGYDLCTWRKYRPLCEVRTANLGMT